MKFHIIDLMKDWCQWKFLFSWHFFFFLLAYSLICGGWAYDGVICVGHVLAVLGPWEGDLEGDNI